MKLCPVPGALEGDPADASAHASAPIGHLSMTLASMRLIPNHDCSAVLRDPSVRMLAEGLL